MHIIMHLSTSETEKLSSDHHLSSKFIQLHIIIIQVDWMNGMLMCLITLSRSECKWFLASLHKQALH